MCQSQLCLEDENRLRKGKKALEHILYVYTPEDLFHRIDELKEALEALKQELDRREREPNGRKEEGA